MAIYNAPESLHVGNGVETVFGFNWPYLLPRDLVVTVNGLPVPTVLASPNQVAVVPAPAALAVVRIYRNTPAQNPTYLFASGIPMLPRYIDGNNKQLLYALQEGLLQFAQTQATADAALLAAKQAQLAAAQAAASAAEQAANIRRTLRARSTDPELQELPSVAARAGRVLGFNSLGDPVGVLPATGSGTELALDLANSTTPGRGAGMVGYSYRTVESKLDDCVAITDYYRQGDGDSWHLAYARAIAVSPRVYFPPKRNPVYLLRAPLAMPDNGFIVGAPGVVLSAVPATDAAGTGIVSLLHTTGRTGLTLVDIKLDGGVREVQTAKNYTRPVRFLDCTNIVCVGVELVNNCDWSISYERCTGVTHTRYKQRSFRYTNPATTTARAGGRDGLHLLDCSDVYAWDLDIDSGDDCVGITSQTVGTRNVTVGGVRGTSVIASLVIYNEEFTPGTSDYAAMPLDALTIRDVRGRVGSVSRNVVRVQKYNPLSTISGVHISGIQGTGSNHGVHLSGVVGGSVQDIDVVSTGQHGVYLSACVGVTGAARGRSVTLGFDGVNLTGGSDMHLVLLSTQAANYGVHVLGVRDSVIMPYARDCGGVSFSGATGGNGRVVNCTNVSVPCGVLSGSTTISYYGLTMAGNTDCTVGADVRLGGYIEIMGNTNPLSVYRTPAAVLKCAIASGGAVTVHSAYNTTIVRVSEGVYQVGFVKPMRSTLFTWTAQAISTGLFRQVVQSAAPTLSTINLSVRTDAGVPVDGSTLTFIAYNS